MKKCQKIGRNQACPCGSGKKYKKCCYITQSPGFSEKIESVTKQKNAEFLAIEVQRKQQQGLGRPIISTQLGDKRLVAVGNKLISGSYKTFHDFLFDYIKRLFGSKWGNAELKKSVDSRHPLLKIYGLMCRQKEQLAKQQNKDGVFTGSMNGASSFYCWLAYNLFLIDHNKGLQDKLIERLKHPDQFAGAAYETFVAAIFVRAGFDIEFIDEDSRKTTHCEFVATHPKTGKKYGVEAKQQNRKSIISQVGGENYELNYHNLGKLLKEALNKSTAYDRIIFLDVNLPSEALKECSYEELQDKLLTFLKEKEKLLDDAPPAYVFLTNHPYHHDQDIENTDHHTFSFADGFKIEDFGFKLMDLARKINSREKHRAIDDLFSAIRNHTVIPSTFDGSNPEFTFGDVSRKLKIGEIYGFKDKEGNLLNGKLVDAVVNIREKVAYGTLETKSGVSITTFKLSDTEIKAYKQHPDTFFGIYKKASSNFKNPYELYEFFESSYKGLSKEELILRLKLHLPVAYLQGLTKDKLLEIYCSSYVNGFYNQNKKGRFWQRDEEGYIVNDTNDQQIDKAYKLIISKLRTLIADYLKEACHSIYLTGSIPRGKASIGQSDLGIVVILGSGYDDKDFCSILRQKCGGLFNKHKWHGAILKIDIELWRFDEIFSCESIQNDSVYAVRDTLSVYHAILKNSSLCIDGENVIPFLPAIKPDLALANNELIQLKDDLSEGIKNIEENADSENVRYWCKRVMKNILHVTFCLIMPIIGEYTRDIDLCTDEAIKHYPSMAASIQQAKDWAILPTDNAKCALDFLNGFGQRLLSEVDAWMNSWIQVINATLLH
jgi:hypothetical protein